MHRFVVLAIDRKTGKTVWERTAREQEPHEASHFENGTWASSSPITDGQRLFAYFESFGLYAYDMNGKLLWEKDLGDKRMRNEFGEGSTPVLHRDTLVVVWDHLNGQSFVTAIDARDGKELWRVPRKEIDTWATPIVLEVNGRPQVVVPAMERVRAYDLAERQRGVGVRRPDDEHDSLAGLRGRHPDPDERVPRQRPQGHPRRRRQGQHRRHAAPSCGRWTATRPTCRRRCSTTASSTS